MTGLGHNRRDKSLPCGFCLTGSLIISQYNQKKGSNNIRKTMVGKLLYIYSRLNCTWLWKNNFQVGKKYFSSWGDMVLQLGSRFSAITAWIYGLNMRWVSPPWCIGKAGLLSQVSSTRPEGTETFKQHVLKGQKLLAQGNARGIKQLARRPERAKA